MWEVQLDPVCRIQGEAHHKALKTNTSSTHGGSVCRWTSENYHFYHSHLCPLVLVERRSSPEKQHVNVLLQSLWRWAPSGSTNPCVLKKPNRKELAKVNCRRTLRLKNFLLAWRPSNSMSHDAHIQDRARTHGLFFPRNTTTGTTDNDSIFISFEEWRCTPFTTTHTLFFWSTLDHSAPQLLDPWILGPRRVPRCV